MNVFDLQPDEYWVMATAVLCGVACALPGCFLVLRRMSLLGDAISHAVLPGLAVAFLLTGSRAAGPMLIGALAVGLLTAFGTETLHRWGKVPSDAAMGVVFTTLFAAGVILITRVADRVDLDPGCVLYGQILLVPYDTRVLLGVNIPYATLVLGAVLAVEVLLFALFFKELKIVSFDPYLAATMGINATLVHYGLMGVVAGTTVASFESVGSILVVAMLIAPGATAHLLTDRLGRMLWLAAASAALSAIGGYLLAKLWNTEVAGMMSVVAGVQFGLAVFFAPRYGYVSKRLHQAALSLRIVREDILGLLYRWQEAQAGRPLDRRELFKALGAGLVPMLALRRLVRTGRVRRHPGDVLTLTESGVADGRTVIRSHRLWESYLARHLPLPLDHLHDPAMRVEHFVTPQIAERLEAEVGRRPDPHGSAIPAGDTKAKP